MRKNDPKNEPLINKLLTHFLMGVALGLSLVLLLGLIEAFHVRELIARSEAPMQMTVMLVTTYGLMFGIGAALTGLVLALPEPHPQAQRSIPQERGADGGTVVRDRIGPEGGEEEQGPHHQVEHGHQEGEDTQLGHGLRPISAES